MTIEKGFVTQTAFKKHLDGNWKTVHELWSHVRDYMTSYPAPAATTYSKTEVDAFFEGYSGGKAQVDAGNVVGLTQGSIPFADASGFLTEDNSKLFWDDTNDNLGLGTTSFGANMVGGIQIATGTAPTGNVADTFAFYSADFAAGNACPHFRTENGTVIGLNQSLLTTSNVVFGTIGCGTITSSGNLIIADAGNIGSASDTDAIQIEADGDIVMSQDLAILGTLAVTGITNLVNLGIGTANPDTSCQVVTTGEIEVASASGGARKKTALGVAAAYGWIDSYHVGTGPLPLWVNPNQGNVFIGSTPSGGVCVNTKMSMGLTMNQGANDDEILAFKSSDVAHGVTDIAETDTYGDILKTIAASGGLGIRGFSEATIALSPTAVATTDNTGKNAAATAPFYVDVYKKNGTGVGVVGANANLMVVCNAGGTRFIVDEDGDILYDGGASSYNDFDDALACRDLSMVLSKQFNQVMVYNKEKLTEMGVLRPFVSTKALNMLELGAIGQLYEKNKELEIKIEALERRLEA